MRPLTARRLGVVGAFVVLAGAFALANVLSKMKEPPKRKTFQQGLPTAEVLPVQNASLPASLDIQGTLEAFDKVDLFAEVGGTLKATSRPFKVGSYFPKGEVLIAIDDEEARLSILSQKSSLLNAITQLMPDLKIDHPQSFEQWKSYLDGFDLEQPIRPFPQPLSEQEKFFIASRNLYTQYYTIKSAETRLAKYTLSAPFNGVLTEALINPGGLVRTGQKLGVLMNSGVYELVGTVPVAELKYVQPGSRVELVSDDIEGRWNGRVKRISDQIDPGTQTVKVYIGVEGKDLREGMYLRGTVDAGAYKQAFELPRNLLVGQDGVYEVRDSTLALRKVEVLRYSEGSVIVSGLPEGLRLLGKPLSGAFEGMKVQVAN